MPRFFPALSRWCRIAAATLLVLPFVSSHVSAQTVIPVTVTDKQGKFVPGLTAADFRLGSASAKLVDVEQVEPLTAADGNSIPIYLVWDAITVPPPVQGTISREVLDMLQQIAQTDEPTAILLNTRQGLKIVHDLNDDPAVLAAALKRGPQSAGTSEFAAQVGIVRERLQPLQRVVDHYGCALQPNLRRTQDQLAAFHQFAQAMARLPQRKALVWLTDQFDMQTDAGGIYLFGGLNEYEFRGPSIDDIQGWAKFRAVYPAILQELNASRVSIFPMMAGVDERHHRHPRLADLAQHTGGYMVASVADLRQKFGPYYLLTVEAATKAKRPAWVKLKIESLRSGVRVTAPPGFFALN